jgi:hypothetical protein
VLLTGRDPGAEGVEQPEVAEQTQDTARWGLRIAQFRLVDAGDAVLPEASESRGQRRRVDDQAFSGHLVAPQ